MSDTVTAVVELRPEGLVILRDSDWKIIQEFVRGYLDSDELDQEVKDRLKSIKVIPLAMSEEE